MGFSANGNLKALLRKHLCTMPWSCLHRSQCSYNSAFIHCILLFVEFGNCREKVPYSSCGQSQAIQNTCTRVACTCWRLDRKDPICVDNRYNRVHTNGCSHHYIERLAKARVSKVYRWIKDCHEIITQKRNRQLRTEQADVGPYLILHSLGSSWNGQTVHMSLTSRERLPAWSHAPYERLSVAICSTAKASYRLCKQT